MITRKVSRDLQRATVLLDLVEVALQTAGYYPFWDNVCTGK